MDDTSFDQAHPEPTAARGVGVVGALPARSAHRSRLTVLDWLLVLTMFLWATNYSVAKAALAILPPHVFNLLRFSLGGLTLTIVLKASRVNMALPRREWLPIIGLAFMNN